MRQKYPNTRQKYPNTVHLHAAQELQRKRAGAMLCFFCFFPFFCQELQRKRASALREQALKSMLLQKQKLLSKVRQG